MHKLLLIAVLGVALPLTLASYIPSGPASAPAPAPYSYGSGLALSAVDAATLQDLQAQIQNGQDSSLVAVQAASQITSQTAPVVQGQQACRTSNVVIATKPLAPIVIKKPEQPPVEVNSGPAAVIRSNPVIYKLAPSVIYQNEVISNSPSPVSLTPVYVKVYKTPAPTYTAPASYAAPTSYAAPASYAAPTSYSAPVAQSDSYGSGAYELAPSAPVAYAAAQPADSYTSSAAGY